MVKAVLRALDSPDAPGLDPAQYRPQDPECFALPVTAIVGPKDGPGEETFDFLVCTPQWLAAVADDRGHIWGRHHLVLPRWSYDAVLQAISRLCERAEGADWHNVADLLGRYGRWEFEDYNRTPFRFFDEE